MKDKIQHSRLLASSIHALLAALHYVRAALVGDSKLCKAARASRRLALTKKLPLDQRTDIVSGLSNTYSDRSRSIFSGRFLGIKEELEYLRLFFIQPAINAIQIIKLSLKFFVLRRKRRHLTSQIRDREILVTELEIKCRTLLLENAQLENKTINMRLLRSSHGELGEQAFGCGEVDHLISSAND